MFSYGKILLSALFFFSSVAYGQSSRITGRITDAETGEPLAFVSLVINDGRFGGYSDIDGKYSLSSTQKITLIKASYVGYQTREIQPAGTGGRIDFSLKRTSIELAEVVILPKENPAHRIIWQVVDHADINNPTKLNDFSYVAYEKMIFTSNLDSISRIDTTTTDSGLIRARMFFENQYFALIENVVERSFKAPDHSLQKVIATKISGLKDPIFVFLLSQLQPVSFYDEIIKIGNQNLVNPVSRGSTSRYFFQIKDTILDAETPDTTFVIFYRPMKYTNFEGLTGLLYITTDRWAIRNVIARPYRQEGQLGISMQQMYEKVDGEHWFPIQLNTDLTFYGVQVQAGKNDTNPYHAVGRGRSYLRDITINGTKSRKEFSRVEIDIDPEASKRDDAFWNQYRTDSLTRKETRTYEFMDSLGKAENFDRKARNIETLITGKIPVGKFDLDLNKFTRFNEFEGLYLGLGFSTNRRLSQFYRLGGYWGYGFHDRTAKYGGTLSLMPFRSSPSFTVNLAYRYDVRETGGVTLIDEQSIVAYERFRNFLILKMDYDEMYQTSVSFRALNYLKVSTFLSRIRRTTGYPYLFITNGEPGLQSRFSYDVTEAGTGFRFAYKEKFLKNARTEISMGTRYPIFFFQYTRGLKGVLEGQYAYDRLDLKITKSFYTKYLGKTSLCLNLGHTEGEVPYANLYNGNGSYRQFTIYVPNSFATMRMNEFLSDRYAALFITHNFGKLLVRFRHFEPEIAVAANGVVGSFRENDRHRYVSYRTLERGYFETGILINNIIHISQIGYGFGAYYRLGTYAFPTWQDNISWKFSFTFPF